MKKLLWLATFLVFASSPAQIFSGESSAILGTEGWFAGALPPPGFHFINYLAYYNSDELRDNDGDKVPVDFKVNLVADCLRGIYVSDIKVLGADLGWHVIVPIVYKDVEIKGSFDEDHFGLGDIYFSPFLLGWHSEIFHWVLGLDIIAPTGQYDKNDNVKIGANHWTFEPALAVSMIHPCGLSASVKLMYDFHTKNTDWINPGTGLETDFLTGQQFHLDYNVGLRIVDGLRLGVCGYYLKGLQDDKIGGDKVPNTREQVFAIGPSAMFSFNPKLHLVAKVQFEMDVEGPDPIGRPEGTSAWLKLICSF